MFDTVSIPMSELEKDVHAYKVLLEAILESPDISEDLKKEAKIKYDAGFFERSSNV